eukprot:g46743.t1
MHVEEFPASQVLSCLGMSRCLASDRPLNASGLGCPFLSYLRSCCSEVLTSWCFLKVVFLQKYQYLTLERKTVVNATAARAGEGGDEMLRCFKGVNRVEKIIDLLIARLLFFQTVETVLTWVEISGQVTRVGGVALSAGPSGKGLLFCTVLPSAHLIKVPFSSEIIFFTVHDTIYFGVICKLTNR